MRKPHIGDPVLYHPQHQDHLKCDGQPLAAFISYVWNPTCVSLMVIDSSGIPHGLSQIFIHRNANEPKPKDGYCEFKDAA